MLSSGRVLGGNAEHFPLEHTSEGERIAFAVELKAEPNLAGRQEGHLEETWLDLVMIGPRSHLGHDGAQVGARTTNLDNGHSNRPAQRSRKLLTGKTWLTGVIVSTSLLAAPAIHRSRFWGDADWAQPRQARTAQTQQSKSSLLTYWG